MDEMTLLILKCVLTIAVALITAYLVPFIKARTSTETQDSVNRAVRIAVQAAEQTLKGGSVKKEEVMDYVTRWLSLRGIKMERDDIDRLVEAVVYAVKNGKEEALG